MADFNGFNTTPEPHALIKVVGVRRRRLERRRSHGGGWRAGRRVHHREHRRAGADALAGRCAHPHRRQADQGPRLGRQPGDRPEGGRGDHRGDLRGAQGRRYGLHHRRHGRRHRHRRGAGDRQHRPGSGPADGRRGDAAVHLRGQPPPQDGRAGHRAAQADGRHADHHPERPAARRPPARTPRCSRRSRWPTMCCARASRASPT